MGIFCLCDTEADLNLKFDHLRNHTERYATLANLCDTEADSKVTPSDLGGTQYGEPLDYTEASLKELRRTLGSTLEWQASRMGYLTIEVPLSSSNGVYKDSDSANSFQSISVPIISHHIRYMYTYIYIYIYMDMCVHTYTCIYKNTYEKTQYTYMHTHMKDIYTHMYKYTKIHTNIHEKTSTHAYIHVHIHIL